MEKDKNVTEDRDKYIGGSDGHKLFNSIRELAFQKVNKDYIKNFSNMYTRYGDKWEPWIRQEMSDEYEVDFQEMTRIDEELGLRANVDGIEIESDGSVGQLGLECKTSIDNKDFDECIRLYKYQLLIYSYAFGKIDWVLAVAFHDGTCESDPYDIEFDDFSFEELLKLCGLKNEEELEDLIFDFWELVDHIRESQLPKTQEDIIRGLLDEVYNLTNEKDDIENEIKLIKIKIKKIMDECGVFKYKNYETNDIITIQDRTKVDRFDKDAFKKDYPKLLEDYTVQSEKEGYVRIKLGADE